MIIFHPWDVPIPVPPELNSKWQHKVTVAASFSTSWKLTPPSLYITKIDIDVYGEAGVLVSANPMDAVFSVMTLDELYTRYELTPPAKSCGTCHHFDAGRHWCLYSRSLLQSFWRSCRLPTPDPKNNGANCKAHQPK